MDDVYLFGNGIRVHRAHLLELQLERYRAPGNPNLHEPVEEEWLLSSFAADAPQRPVFLDIGAGIGYYSILVRVRFPAARVVAVDALPRHVAAMRANLAINGLSPQDLEIIEEAVATCDGNADFVDSGYGSALADEARLPLEGRRSIRVPARTLATLLDNLPDVHLMKMDIQGAELVVLSATREALRAGRVRHALIGTHGAALHAGVRSVLEESGFTIVVDDPAPPMQPDGIVLGRHRR